MSPEEINPSGPFYTTIPIKEQINFNGFPIHREGVESQIFRLFLICVVTRKQGD